MKPFILNQAGSAPHASDFTDIYTRIYDRISQLKGEFYDVSSGGVNYAQLKASELFDDYTNMVNQLSGMDLQQIQSIEQQLAFWINIYNALVVHGIAVLGVENSVRDFKSFFSNIFYSIGGHLFSPDDIEHGILRSNSCKYRIGFKPFGKSDPRRQFVLSKLDPRIHFALVCGSKSCPAIGVYHEDQIDSQLDIAAGNFVESDVDIDMQRQTITLSKVFKWYRFDFGSQTDLIYFIEKYRDNQDEKDFLRNYASRLKIKYFSYDWSLNHMGGSGINKELLHTP